MSLISEVCQLDGLPEKASKHLKKEVFFFLRSMSKVLESRGIQDVSRLCSAVFRVACSK